MSGARRMLWGWGRDRNSHRNRCRCRCSHPREAAPASTSSCPADLCEFGPDSRQMTSEQNSAKKVLFEGALHRILHLIFSKPASLSRQPREQAVLLPVWLVDSETRCFCCFLQLVACSETGLQLSWDKMGENLFWNEPVSMLLPVLCHPNHLDAGNALSSSYHKVLFCKALDFPGFRFPMKHS